MIDVHCLVHKESKYFYELEKQMKEESDISFHVVSNKENIGLGRVNGFMKGYHKYVSYVDYDDLIEPGIFAKINRVMDTGIPWCYTNEILIDEDGNKIQPGWSSNPELYSPAVLDLVRVNIDEHVHHILTFRRDLITPKILYIMRQLNELPEEYLRTELEKYSRLHINEVGYYWRQHNDNSCKKYEIYKDLERVKNDKRIHS